MSTYIGIDLGKTRLRIGIFEFDLATTEVLSIRRRPAISTPLVDVESLTDACIAGIRAAIASVTSVDAVGIGAFGVVDPASGSVLKGGSVEFWNGVPLASIIASGSGIPCYLIGDVAAAAFGHATQLHDPTDCFSLVQIGTSVGVGACGGHLNYSPDAPNFGQISRLSAPSGAAWGDTLGGKGFRLTASRSFGRPVQPREVFHMASHGDGRALTLVEEYVGALGDLCALLAVMHSPRRILVAGGMVNALRPLETQLQDSYRSRTASLWSAPALELRSDKGMGEIGAARWAMKQHTARGPRGSDAGPGLAL
ncbi:ROK family protein [Kribbella sp. NPDC050241]|uniref:ROK family protein n=1 Tax=Kribbella sp. NPDC050241 TaxID=3364115 RepID=UPI0037A672C2